MGKRKKQTGQSALNERLKLVIKSGKWVIGWNETLRSVRQNKSKLIIVANNTPGLKRSQLEYYCMLGRVPVIHYEGTNNDLGRACGKLYSGSVLSVMDPGDSDLLKVIDDKRKEKRAKQMKMQAPAV